MAFFVAYQAVDTLRLFDPQFITYSVQDIATLYEFRSHENNPLDSLHEALDVWGLTMNDANFAIVQSIGHYTSASAITDPTDNQSLDWQVIGLSVAYTSLFGASNFGAALLAGNDTIVGSGDADRLNGFSGNDVIFGGAGVDELHGGVGRDVLTGGPGGDQFYFDGAIAPANLDRITDFAHAIDQLWLDPALFHGINVGALHPAFFHQGALPADGNDYIIYNRATGGLFYDRDGSGTHFHPIEFAVIANHAHLTASDIHGLGLE